MNESVRLDRVPELIRRHQPGRILLVTHLRPDGDALGSLCGTLLLLKQQGFRADAVLPGSVPDYYRELSG